MNIVEEERKPDSPRCIRSIIRHALTGCLGAIVILLAPIESATGARGEDVQRGQQLFQTLCTPCHRIGGGKLVGPDLSGVTSRRETGWLKRQIKEPDELIAEKDPIVMELLKESNNVPMVPLGLDDNDVIALIEYLKSTEQQAQVESGLPSRYLPTLFASIVLLAALTVVGLRVGTKKVDVR